MPIGERQIPLPPKVPRPGSGPGKVLRAENPLLRPLLNTSFWEGGRVWLTCPMQAHLLPSLLKPFLNQNPHLWGTNFSQTHHAPLAMSLLHRSGSEAVLEGLGHLLGFVHHGFSHAAWIAGFGHWGGKGRKSLFSRDSSYCNLSH